jgi:Zinc finger, C3HC4 type (RING finger)
VFLLFFTASSCQKSHYLVHKQDCVDFETKARALLQPRPFFKPLEAPDNTDCPVCGKSPMDERSAVILEECNHAACFGCLRRRIDVNNPDHVVCPLCQHSQIVRGNVQEILVRRAEKYAANATRPDVTEEEKRENLERACVELDKVQLDKVQLGDDDIPSESHPYRFLIYEDILNSSLEGIYRRGQYLLLAGRPEASIAMSDMQLQGEMFRVTWLLYHLRPIDPDAVAAMDTK